MFLLTTENSTISTHPMVKNKRLFCSIRWDNATKEARGHEGPWMDGAYHCSGCMADG